MVPCYGSLSKLLQGDREHLRGVHAGRPELQGQVGASAGRPGDESEHSGGGSQALRKSQAAGQEVRFASERKHFSDPRRTDFRRAIQRPREQHGGLRVWSPTEKLFCFWLCHLGARWPWASSPSASISSFVSLGIVILLPWHDMRIDWSIVGKIPGTGPNTL